MASYQFTAGQIGCPIGVEPRWVSVPLILENVRGCISRSAGQLNASRGSFAKHGFARVYVTEIYQDSRFGTPEFTVTFSDDDHEMSARMKVIVAGLVKRALEL